MHNIKRSQFERIKVFETMFHRISDSISFYLKSRFINEIILHFEDRILYQFEKFANKDLQNLFQDEERNTFIEKENQVEFFELERH